MITQEEFVKAVASNNLDAIVIYLYSKRPEDHSTKTLKLIRAALWSENYHSGYKHSNVLFSLDTELNNRSARIVFLANLTIALAALVIGIASLFHR